MEPAFFCGVSEAQLEDLNNESEIEISPFVESMSSGICIPAEFDFKSEYLNHLIEKNGSDIKFCGQAVH
ncbi:MAG: hypothetical protein EOM83_00310 [Clostridia bacterium]|nr:hypothetical protein [Clostridia bacterium]